MVILITITVLIPAACGIHCSTCGVCGKGLPFCPCWKYYWTYKSNCYFVWSAW